MIINVDFKYSNYLYSSFWPSDQNQTSCIFYKIMYKLLKKNVIMEIPQTLIDVETLSLRNDWRRHLMKLYQCYIGFLCILLIKDWMSLQKKIDADDIRWALHHLSISLFLKTKSKFSTFFFWIVETNVRAFSCSFFSCLM